MHGGVCSPSHHTLATYPMRYWFQVTTEAHVSKSAVYASDVCLCAVEEVESSRNMFNHYRNQVSYGCRTSTVDLRVISVQWCRDTTGSFLGLEYRCANAEEFELPGAAHWWNYFFTFLYHFVPCCEVKSNLMGSWLCNNNFEVPEPRIRLPMRYQPDSSLLAE